MIQTGSTVPLPRGRRWVALAGVAWLAATPMVVHGQATSETSTTTVNLEPAAAPPALPFWVAGVVIGPERRSAVLVPLDGARREVGLVRLHVGESYGEYRLVAVEADHVVLAGNGLEARLGVGRPVAGPRGPSDARPVIGPIFIPGPDRPRPEVEYSGPQVPRGLLPVGATADRSGEGDAAVQSFLDRLFSHPQMQQQIEELRPIIRQKVDRARQDGQPPAVLVPPAPSQPK